MTLDCERLLLQKRIELVTRPVCYQVQSSRCKGWVTEDGYMRQAAALWEASEGDETKPASQKLLREVTRDAHQKDLKKDFEGFLSHIKENR